MRSVSNCRRGVSQALGDRGPKSLIRDEQDRETKDPAAWCLRRSFSGSPSRAGFCRSVGLIFLVVCLVGCATVATPHLRWMMNERSSGRGIWMFAPAVSWFLSFFLSSRRRIHIVAESKKHRACVEGRQVIVMRKGRKFAHRSKPRMLAGATRARARAPRAPEPRASRVPVLNFLSGRTRVLLFLHPLVARPCTETPGARPMRCRDWPKHVRKRAKNALWLQSLR